MYNSAHVFENKDAFIEQITAYLSGSETDITTWTGNLFARTPDITVSNVSFDVSTGICYFNNSSWRAEGLEEQRAIGYPITGVPRPGPWEGTGPPSAEAAGGGSGGSGGSTQPAAAICGIKPNNCDVYDYGKGIDNPQRPNNNSPLIISKTLAVPGIGWNTYEGSQGRIYSIKTILPTKAMVQELLPQYPANTTVEQAGFVLTMQADTSVADSVVPDLVWVSWCPGVTKTIDSRDGNLPKTAEELTTWQTGGAIKGHAWNPVFGINQESVIYFNNKGTPEEMGCAMPWGATVYINMMLFSDNYYPPQTKMVPLIISSIYGGDYFTGNNLDYLLPPTGTSSTNTNSGTNNNTYNYNEKSSFATDGSVTKSTTSDVPGVTPSEKIGAGDKSAIIGLASQLHDIGKDSQSLGLAKIIKAMATPDVYGESVKAALIEGRNMDRLLAAGIIPAANNIGVEEAIAAGAEESPFDDLYFDSIVGATPGREYPQTRSVDGFTAIYDYKIEPTSSDGWIAKGTGSISPTGNNIITISVTAPDAAAEVTSKTFKVILTPTVTTATTITKTFTVALLGETRAISNVIFTASTNVAPNSILESNTVTLTGFSGEEGIYLDSGELEGHILLLDANGGIIDDVEPGETAAVINGTRLKLQVVAPSEHLITTSVKLIQIVQRSGALRVLGSWVITTN
jgi:hypothetical protein